jgi:hypothetical protein
MTVWAAAHGGCHALLDIGEQVSADAALAQLRVDLGLRGEASWPLVVRQVARLVSQVGFLRARIKWMEAEVERLRSWGLRLSAELGELRPHKPF